VPRNDQKLQANCNLYDLFPANGINAIALTAMLNSTITVLSKYQFGRPVGNEGNLKTEIVDVSMMLVPSLASATKALLMKLEAAFTDLAKRNPLQFLSEQRMRRMAFERAGREAQLADLGDLSELDMADRRALDHAVLEILGVKSEKERTQWINDLYDYLREFFEEARQKEELAISNKNVSKRRGAASPQDLATQIVHHLRDEEPRWFKGYRDFLREAPSASDFIAIEVPHDGEPEFHQDILSLGVRFMRGRRQIGFSATPTRAHAEILVLAAKEKRSPAMRVPRSEAAATSLLQNFGRFLKARNSRLRELVAERVADDEIRMQVLQLVIDRVRNGGDDRRV